MGRATPEFGLRTSIGDSKGAAAVAEGGRSGQARLQDDSTGWPAPRSGESCGSFGWRKDVLVINVVRPVAVPGTEGCEDSREIRVLLMRLQPEAAQRAKTQHFARHWGYSQVAAAALTFLRLSPTAASRGNPAFGSSR